MRRLRLAVVCAGVALALTGCAARPAPTLSVQPSSIAPDRPLRVSVAGLEPGSLVTLHLSTAPTSGASWTSTATFRADADGRVTTTQAPTRGDYRGARVDGLEEALHPPRGDASGFAVPTTTPWRLQLTASVDGNPVAHATATRRTCLTAVTLHRLTLSRDHVLGILYEPKHPSNATGPGVLTIGGSGGGLGLFQSACDLAADGIPSLSIAYFHAAGLPDQLQRVPIEYFGTAARLLARAPGVDPAHLVLWGDSRGSEAAALTAAHYPALVRGAILTVPAAVAGPAPDVPAEPAWTYHDHPVPTEGLGAALHDPTAAALPVEQIDGPVLAVCAGRDAVWPSCPQAAQLAASARSHDAATRFTLLTYPAAGHFLGSLAPYYPTTAFSTVADGNTTVSGGTPLADAEARDDAWPHLLTWLHHL